jgi:hypothetical protein
MAQEGSLSQHGASNPMPGHQPPARIGLEELVEAASNGVLRAVEARKIGESSPSLKLPFPILIGIIFLPEGWGNLAAGQPGVPASQENAAP